MRHFLNFLEEKKCVRVMFALWVVCFEKVSMYFEVTQFYINLVNLHFS